MALCGADGLQREGVSLSIVETEVELTLTPGRHTLQLVLGDHLHIPHDPPIASSVVTIEVQ